jgi:hypothetical protein
MSVGFIGLGDMGMPELGSSLLTVTVICRGNLQWRLLMSESVRTVAVVGTGVIGASWAAHFLAHDCRVVATDPAPGAEERLRAAVDTHWRWLHEQGRVVKDSYVGLDFDADLERAVSGAQFVLDATLPWRGFARAFLSS